MSNSLQVVSGLALERFLRTPLDDLLTMPDKADLEIKLLSLFRRSAAEVPAYRHFLTSHRIAPDRIEQMEYFQSLPLMDKANYMQVYPLPERCFEGSLKGADRIAVSSGSTGKSTFWPRTAADELAVAVRFEQVFHDNFYAHQRSTLAVVCFAMGNWVGGLFTTSCCWHLAQKGYPLMVATPGNHKAEILRIVRELGPYYEQTVLLGYPPFVKDVIDTGIAAGINWADYHPKLVFAGEVFSEEWRELVGLRIGSASACFDSASLYGTADGGVLGNETPFSIAIRRWLANHPLAARQLFGESRMPTLVQYDPASRYFEVHEGTLVVSCENSVPLLRYHIADQGGLISFEAMWAFLKSHGVNSVSALGLPSDFEVRTLPFAYVFGRADFTVSYYGANIYPENISVGLEQAGIIDKVSGKFVLQTCETDAGDKLLQIAVELLPEVEISAELEIKIAESIRTQLLRLNSEFANYTPVERQKPQITLLSFADPEYFPAGIKHRYTRRN